MSRDGIAFADAPGMRSPSNSWTSNTSFLMLALLTGCGASTAASPPTPGAEDGSRTTEEPAADANLDAAPFCGASAVGYDATAKAIFAALTPDAPADYLALRQNVGGVPSPGLSEELALVTERGALCGGATDPATCTKSYDALSPPIRLGFHHCFTRGDDVGCVENTNDALALIGHVHSVEEAFFVAEYAGYDVTCGAPTAARAKALDDGSFRLVVMKRTSGGPCGQIHRAVIDVSRDGTVAEIETKLVDDNPSCP